MSNLNGKQNIKSEGSKPKARKRFVTKSNMITSLKCPITLYNKIHNYKAEEFKLDSFAKHITKEGRIAEEIVKKHYSENSVEIDFNYRELELMAKLTKKAVNKKLQDDNICKTKSQPSAIMEASFIYRNFFVAVDVLKNNHDGTWDIIEIKAATSQKPYYMEDIAFQKYVIEKKSRCRVFL